MMVLVVRMGILARKSATHVVQGLDQCLFGSLETDNGLNDQGGNFRLAGLAAFCRPFQKISFMAVVVFYPVRQEDTKFFHI